MIEGINPSTEEFLNIIKELICTPNIETLSIKLIISNCKKNTEISKIAINAYKDYFKCVENYTTKQITKNFTNQQLINYLETILNSKIYKRFEISTNKKTAILYFNNKWEGVLKNYNIKANQTTLQKIDKATIPPFNLNLKNKYYSQLSLTSLEGANYKINSSKIKKVTQITEFVRHLNTVLKKYYKTGKKLNIIDAGCGKGYLTFALHDYLSAQVVHKSQEEELKPNPSFKIVGIDTKQSVINNINTIVSDNNLKHIEFEFANVSNYNFSNFNIALALHLCNTATDVFLSQCIKSNIELIVFSPCCHQELNPQVRNQDIFSSILKHGIFKEKQAEIITDTLRTILLEYFGYKTTIIDFVSSNHSGKNNLIIAYKQAPVHNAKPKIKSDFKLEEYKKLASTFNVNHFTLYNLLLGI